MSPQSILHGTLWAHTLLCHFDDMITEKNVHKEIRSRVYYVAFFSVSGGLYMSSQICNFYYKLYSVKARCCFIFRDTIKFMSAPEFYVNVQKCLRFYISIWIFYDICATWAHLFNILHLCPCHISIIFCTTGVRTLCTSERVRLQLAKQYNNLGSRFCLDSNLQFYCATPCPFPA